MDGRAFSKSSSHASDGFQKRRGSNSSRPSYLEGTRRRRTLGSVDLPQAGTKRSRSKSPAHGEDDEDEQRGGNRKEGGTKEDSLGVIKGKQWHIRRTVQTDDGIDFEEIVQVAKKTQSDR
jgi:hypothetical protein